MSQNKRKIQTWQIERSKARGSARLRRAALALYLPSSQLGTPPGFPTGERHLPDCAQARGWENCDCPITATAGVTRAGRAITEIGGNGAADTAAGCLEDCESDSRRHSLQQTELYMSAKPQELKPETPEIVPQGSIMAPYISTALLLGDDAEKTLRRQIAARVSPPVRAGLAWGAITHGIWTTNSYAPEKGETFIRWHGEIGFQKRDGSLGEATVAYLPKPVTADLLTAGVPVVREGLLPAPMVATFSVECWCVPVRQEPGYGYEIRNRQGRRRNINALAPPEVQALLPHLPPPVVFEAEPAQLEYDTETGEIYDIAADGNSLETEPGIERVAAE